MSDVALVLDDKGVIRDLAFSNNDLAAENHEHWLGRRWIDTVTVESKAKVEMLLRDADTEASMKARELNHRLFSGQDLPIRYSAVQMGRSGPIIAVGRDMRMISRLQQRLMDAQRSMERDYLRLRNVETRYRILFQLSGEAILIVDASGLKIVDINPAAGLLLESTAGRLVGRSILDVFDSASRDNISNLIDAARNAVRVESARIVLPDGRACFLSASLFRQDDASHMLMRLLPAVPNGHNAISTVKSQVLQAVEDMPEAFLVVGPDRMIIEANTAFLEVAELSNHTQARGQTVDRWLGRSSVEINVLFANLKEHGAVRDFATVIRSEYGSTEDVEIAGVSVTNTDRPCFGLVIRSVRRRFENTLQAKPEQSRSASQLSELVGRVPLKELVRETTELTERLCIEASLNLTGDNRAAAAQMLGLSRQSLYSKLRRYNIGDLGTNEDGNPEHEARDS
ncbi:MAG: transcriptional regulator PpsR [Beijerinckiaceae bacterium]|nr:transcriptional regulator PpsR [Beijerinckiaceae bacterium]